MAAGLPVPAGVLAMVVADLGVGVRAGFSTRDGGVGEGRFATANMSASVGDDPAVVGANRARLAAWAGAPVVFHRQVHGVRVARAGDPPTDADAVLGGPGDAVAVLAADCLPVLLADTAAGVAAAAHAGRRGLAAGVLQATVRAMTARGADPARIVAVVGPGICGRCYEVPAAMREEVADLVPGTASTTRTGTAALDLPAGAVGVLTRAGVGSVRSLGTCTAESTALFSHRRDGSPGAPTGRIAAVVRLSDRVAPSDRVGPEPGSG